MGKANEGMELPGMWYEINHMMFMIDLTWCDMWHEVWWKKKRFTGTCTWYVRSKLVKHGPAMPPNTRYRAWHTLPRLARSTLNDVQQNQHEKASLVCVRVQSPSELALVPCALSMVDLSGQLRCWITHTCLVQKNVLFSIFGTLCSYDPLWRGFFFPWKTKEKMALFSRAPHDYWK